MKKATRRQYSKHYWNLQLRNLERYALPVKSGVLMSAGMMLVFRVGPGVIFGVNYGGEQ